jgi:uncharacterized membrane protein YfcA
LPLQTNFEKSGVTHSALLPLTVGGLVGLLGAIMGLGGGFIMIPLTIYVLRMPMHTAVGTNLFQEIFLCAEVTFFQAYSNHTVDFILALLLLSGSILGAQIGARYCKKLKEDTLKILLATIILAVDIKVILEVTMTPASILARIGGH